MSYFSDFSFLTVFSNIVLLYSSVNHFLILLAMVRQDSFCSSFEPYTCMCMIKTNTVYDELCSVECSSAGAKLITG